jgi:hypothetical protein
MTTAAVSQATIELGVIDHPGTGQSAKKVAIRSQT